MFDDCNEYDEFYGKTQDGNYDNGSYFGRDLRAMASNRVMKHID